MKTLPLFWILPLLLGGCSLSVPQQEKQTYLLASARPAAAPAQSTPLFKAATLRIRDLRATAPFRDTALIYRETDQRYVADEGNLFATAPSSLVSERLRTWIAASGLFQSVWSAGSSQLSNYLIEGEITALYADVRNPKAPAVEISGRLQLIQDQAKGVRIVLDWPFTQRQAIPAADANHVAQGMDQALTQILSNFEQTLRAQHGL